MTELRWMRDDGSLCTWLETLTAACDYYGRFSGRWHSNAYWRDLRARAATMSEIEAEAAVRQFEREAEGSLAEWRFYQ